jgi:uncharacterized protein YbjT (DUF2867 family)
MHGSTHRSQRRGRRSLAVRRHAAMLVPGGTGKTGRRVVQRLAALHLPVRIGSRSIGLPFDWQRAHYMAAGAGRRPCGLHRVPARTWPGRRGAGRPTRPPRSGLGDTATRAALPPRRAQSRAREGGPEAVRRNGRSARQPSAAAATCRSSPGVRHRGTRPGARGHHGPAPGPCPPPSWTDATST